MSSPILGGLTLSGATHVVITDNDYVMEHQVPGMDGGIVERIGSDLFRIKIQGFSSSGDADKPQFLAMLNTSQSLNVPSMAPSTSLFSGSVYIKEFNIGPLAGRGYPVYSWVINTLASGQLNVAIPLVTLVASGRTIARTNSYYNSFETFHANGRFWAFYTNAASDTQLDSPIYYKSAPDSTFAWNTEQVVGSGLTYWGSYSIWFDGTYVHYLNATTDGYRRGTPNTDGSITWSAAEQSIAYSGFGAIGVTTDSNGHPWFWSPSAKDANNDGTWSLASGWPTINAPNIVVPLTGGKVSTLGVSTGVFVQNWNGTSFNSGVNWPALNEATSAVAVGDDVWLLSLSTNLQTQYLGQFVYGTNFIGTSVKVWGTGASGSLVAQPAMCYDAGQNTIYMFSWAPFNGVSGAMVYKTYNIGTSTLSPEKTFFTLGSGEWYSPYNAVQCSANAQDGLVSVAFAVAVSGPTGSTNLKFAWLNG